MKLQLNKNYEASLKRMAKPEIAEAAITVRDEAKAIAPVGSPADDDRTPGAYRDGIKVVKSGVATYVSATDFKSHWIEWGTGERRTKSGKNVGRMPVFAVIRRAVIQTGLRLDEKPKGETEAESPGT